MFCDTIIIDKLVLMTTWQLALPPVRFLVGWHVAFIEFVFKMYESSRITNIASP